MALVDIPGRASLNVPDSWGRDEVTDFVRQTYPDLFEPASVDAGPSATTLGPDRAPLSPAERQARIDSIRGEFNPRFVEEQSRIADLDALEASREAGGISGFLGSSDIMAGPRRVAAGAANFLRAPGAIVNAQIAPLLAMDATRPAAERIAQLLADMDRGLEGAGQQLRVTERPDAEPSLADVYGNLDGSWAGRGAAAADLGTLGVNAIADSAAYLLPGGLVSRGLANAGLSEKAARTLGPLISVAPVETAEALSEYLEAGADPVAARVVAPVVGLINGLLESVTDSKVLARLGGGDAAKKGAARFLIGQVFGEGLTEGLQEGSTIGGRAALTGSPGPDVANRVGTAVAGGMFGGAGLGGAVELANRITAPAPLTARGVPVDVARAELIPGEVPTGSVPIASGPVEGALGAVRDYVPLGKKKRKAALNFARIAEEEGVADLVDFIPEAKKTADGASVEGEFVDGRFRVYVPNIRNENRLRGALREEKAHGWIATEAGQAALTEFVDRRPLTDAEWTKLQSDGYLQQEGEDASAYVRRLSDEFVAKLNRDPKWKQWVGEAVAWVKEKIGVSLTNAQAGRLMLRNLRKVGVGQSGGQSRQSMVGWDEVPGQSPAPKSPEVVALEQKWAESGVRLQVSETPSGLVLNVIESPGKGLGGRALADVVRLSESRGAPVSLTASAQPGRAEDLARFYERAGFQKVAEDPLSKRPIYRRTPAPRFSLAPEKAAPLLDSIRTEFPSAPPIIVGDPDPRGAYYDGANIVVSPGDLPGNPAAARATILSALVESGLDVFGPTFAADTYGMLRESDPNGTARIAERLGADPKTPEGQRAILGEVIRLRGQDSRLTPWLRKWMRKLRSSPTDRLRDNLARLAQTTLATYEIPENLRGAAATPAAQAYADLNRAIWTYAKPVIDRLRDLAIDERFAQEDDRKFRNLSSRMRALSDSARATDVSLPGPNPTADDFIQQVEVATNSLLSDADKAAHREFLIESQARDLVKVLDERDDLLGLQEALRDKSPRYNPEDVAAQLTELEERISKASVEAASRADLLRAHAARKWESRSASTALQDPQIQAWLEIIERIEQSGATPQEATGELSRVQRTVQDIVALSWRPFRRRTQEVYDAFMTDVYPKQLAGLREKIDKILTDRVSAHVAVEEILRALQGTAGLSGSSVDRQTAEFLAENDALLQRFIVALARTSPNTAVARLRDRIMGTLTGAIENSDIEQAAQEAGVSKDSLRRVLEHIAGSPASRNAIVTAYDSISDAVLRSALAAIRNVEGAADKKEAAELAAAPIARFMKARGRAIDLLRGAEEQVAQLEARRVGLLMLRDAGAVELPTPEVGVTEMVYDTADRTIVLKGFTRADQTEQPEIRLDSETIFDRDFLAKLIEWQEQAHAAIEAASNDEPVTRGLEVAVGLVNLYIDANFTPEMITKTPAPSWLQLVTTGGTPFTLWQNISTRNNLGRLVPGVLGQALRAAARDVDNAGLKKERIERAFVKKKHKAMLDAAESLGLDLRAEGDSILLQDAHNEAAHYLRQYGSGVSPGDPLWSEGIRGKQITPELLNLVRLDRQIGREAQVLEGERKYSGIRMDLPGERIMRPPMETGDIGLSRKVRSDLVEKLAAVYRTKDPVQIQAFWESSKARDAIARQLADAQRSDLGTPRTLQAAEEAAWNKVRHGRAPFPKTLDDAVSLLVAESGLSRAEVRSQFLEELAQMGRLAMAAYPADGSAPTTTEGVRKGVDEDSPFTLQAAPLIYPSSWYDYGTSTGLGGFLESAAAVPTRAYMTRALEAAAELRRIHDELTSAATPAELAAVREKYKNQIRWFTNNLSRFLRLKVGKKGRAQHAATTMKLVSDLLTLSVEDSRPSWFHAKISGVASTIRGVMPFLLSDIGSLITNVLSGGSLAFQMYRPLYGPTAAAAKTAYVLLSAIHHFGLDRIERAAEKVGLNLKTRAERTAYLQAHGVAGSYSRADMGEQQSWSQGQPTPGLVGRAWAQTQEVANKVSEIQGTRLGDPVLNAHIMRVVVKDVVRKLQRIQATWAGRLDREGKTYSKEDETTYLAKDDVSGAPEIRQMLGQFAESFGTPEEFLNHVAGVDAKYWWRDPLVGELGQFLLTEINAATRNNRPMANPLLTLLGWPSHAIAQIAADMRTVPDDPLWKKVGQITSRSMATFAILSLAYWMSKAARLDTFRLRTELASELQRLLAGLDDDEDIDGIMDILTRLVRLIRRIPGAHVPLDLAAHVAGALRTPPTDTSLTPFDKSWYGQPLGDIAMDVATAPIKSIGFDPENPRTPISGIVDTIGRGTIQVGMGVGEIAKSIASGDEGMEAAGKADLKEGTRKAMGVFSIFGRVAYNLFSPEYVAAREVKAEIVRHAKSLGIQISKPPPGAGGWLPRTPKEQALREAARRGDEESLRSISKFAFDQSYKRAIDKGQSPDEAQSAGEQAVKSLLVALDPVRDAIGGPVTEEQYRKLEPLLGPKVREAVAQKNRAVQAIAERPPEGMRRFSPTPAMETPVKQTPGRRASFRGSRRRSGRRPNYLARRRTGRSRRRVRLRV